jgi:MinD-like ATPase involved in chromosome partitioning or flagellar assembly
MNNQVGKVISIGSVKHGQGITSFTYNLAYTLANTTPFEILILDINFLYGEMDFLSAPKTNTSIDDLISCAKNHQLTKEFLMEHTESLEPKLKIINPSKLESSDYLKKNFHYITDILQCAKECFDIVIVDTVGGSQSPVSRQIKSYCDVFINLMTQNPYILEWYKSFRGKGHIKQINIVNMFEEDITPTSSQIEKNYGISHMKLPYSIQMRSHYNNRTIQKFLTQDDPYNQYLFLIIQKLLQLLDINIELKDTKSINKKSIFDFFK